MNTASKGEATVRKIVIPIHFGQPTVTVWINQHEYVFETGRQIEVDNFIADFIERNISGAKPDMAPVSPPFQCGAVNTEDLQKAIDDYFVEHPVDAIPDEQIEAAVAWYMEDNPITLTEADKASMVAQVKASFDSELWTFTLEDGTIVEKDVALL